MTGVLLLLFVADGFLAGAESDGEVGGKRSLEGGTEEERAAKMMREAAADYQLTSGAYGNRGIKAQVRMLLLTCFRCNSC